MRRERRPGFCLRRTEEWLLCLAAVGDGGKSRAFITYYAHYSLERDDGCGCVGARTKDLANKANLTP